MVWIVDAVIEHLISWDYHSKLNQYVQNTLKEVLERFR
jgi:hypothetical protein